MSEHPPGAIIVPVADHLRYTQFFTSFEGMWKPAGSALSIPRSSAITHSLNHALYTMPEECEWALLMGDDHVLGPDLLKNLLDMEVDVAVPLCVKRSPPYQLVIFDSPGEEDFVDPETGRIYPMYSCWEYDKVPEEPFKVYAAGSAGMLIRRRVLEALEKPWFESTDGASQNEDLAFCMKLREAGFDIWCNPKEILGHISEVVLWPTWKDGRLICAMDAGNGKIVGFEDPVPETIVEV